MSDELEERKNKAIEQAEILLRGIRSGHIHSFIAVAVGDAADETYHSDITGRNIGTRLIGLMSIIQVRVAARFGTSNYVRGPQG